MNEAPMTSQTDYANSAAGSGAGHAGIVSLLATLIRLVRASGESGKLLWLVAALVMVVAATAYAQIRLNAWNEPFYDAINSRDIAAFGFELGVYAMIAGTLLVLNVSQTWLNLMMKLKLREILTRDLFQQWLAPRRAFMIANAGPIGVNPDQRIHEDARHFTELSTDLGVGLFQATLLLVSFIGVLWSLSSGVSFTFEGSSFVVPGYMVWSALLYAGLASLASWRVGRPLVNLNAERYARESDMRFSLVRVNQNCDGVAVYRGEAQERGRLDVEFNRLLDVVRRLVGATTRLAWVTAGYGWFTIVAPVIVAAPAYFAGNLTFGGLLMAVGAFTQVQQSLRWFVDNANPIADWKATLLRVSEFRQALIDIDRTEQDARRIEIAETDSRIVLDDVNVLLPPGRSSLSVRRVAISPGERVVIVGGPSSGKTSLFRALAGLWPWGTGHVELPAEDVMFMPKHPYLPGGSLRDVLAYPYPPEKFSDADFYAALNAMGLPHLVSALDTAAPWEKELSDPEQQGLAFARLLLHGPRWVVIDTAIDTLSPQTRRALFDALRKELPQTSVLAISGVENKYDFFDRLIRLSLRLENDGAEGLSATSV
ncbi:ABC transporter [Methylocystis echinoides]|uniref:ABC transporter n=2 Tax=Methylocystis echinoides TaxID=29468 RepID=A0A9W6GTJ2_9HYPH|nr:ABC transporter [Methylocystis echinoides]